MALTRLEIIGYRGFRNRGVLRFAVPNGAFGSGLSLLTGPNNSGKSSILECLRARGGSQLVSFTAGTRNSAFESVEIQYTVNDKAEFIRSVSKGSSETTRTDADASLKLFVLPSRRAFNPYFGRAEWGRDQFLQNSSLPAQRSAVLSYFEYRLFNILKNPKRFNELASLALGYTPSWTIDQSDQGQYFLKFFNGSNSHSSDGMGEGIISVFAIVDALHDSSAGDVIVIDEPELSLHPALQRRMIALLGEFARDRQLILSTHSPYFVNLIALANGGSLARVTTGPGGTAINELSVTSKNSIRQLASNLNNPHIFGLDSRELFFQEDCIVLTEGQDDVMLYPQVAEQLQVSLPGNFFGWGVGGAGNMRYVCGILRDLGFTKVAALLDSDKQAECDKLQTEFPEYLFKCILARDVRTKPPRGATEAVEGLLDGDMKLRDVHIDPLKAIFEDIAKHLTK